MHFLLLDTMPTNNKPSTSNKGSSNGKSKHTSMNDSEDSAFQQMLSLLKNTVDSLNSTVSTLNNTVATLEQSVQAQQKIIERLESRILEQDKQIAELKNQHQRHDRLKLLKFSGLTCSSDDGKEEVLQCIRDKMNVQISNVDIVSRILRPRSMRTSSPSQFPELSHASQKGSSETLTPEPVTVLVSFHNIWLRKQVYYSKKALRNTKIFVSEDLSKEDSHLFYLCRQLRKQGKIKAAWTKEMTVFIKTLTDDVKTVKSESDLDEFNDQASVEPTTSEVTPVSAMKPAAKQLPPRSIPVTRSKAAAMQSKPKVTVVADISSSSSSSSEEDDSSDEEDVDTSKTH